VIDYFRLAFGTIVVLVPGLAVARALGRRSVSAVVAWSLASAFVAWAVVFTVHSSIRLAVLVLAAITIVAAIVGRRRRLVEDEPRAPAWVLGAGIVLGWLLWRVADVIVGDGLFHEARVRKLLAFGDLHLRTVDEFKDGGLHPGYAFPLWHGFVALIAWFSGVDAHVVIRYAPSVLAPLACAVVWEAGVAVFRSRLAGLSLLVASLALFCFGAGHGGAYAVLPLPATATRQLLVPAAIAIFFTARTPAGWATLGVQPGPFPSVRFWAPVKRSSACKARPRIRHCTKLRHESRLQVMSVKVRSEPLAAPTIMAGLNQMIMMTLSMVVVASMIGARGLGEQVLNGIQTLDVGKGLEGGIGIVILAIVLDRITQGFGRTRTDDSDHG